MTESWHTLACSESELQARSSIRRGHPSTEQPHPLRDLTTYLAFIIPVKHPSSFASHACCRIDFRGDAAAFAATRGQLDINHTCNRLASHPVHPSCKRSQPAEAGKRRTRSEICTTRFFRGRLYLRRVCLHDVPPVCAMNQASGSA